MATPPPPPAGLDVQLTHEGFRCELAPAWIRGGSVLQQVAEASVFWFVLGALTIACTALMLLAGSATLGGAPSGAFWVLVLCAGAIAVLVAGGIASYAVGDAWSQRRWTVNVGLDTLQLSPMVLGRVLSTHDLRLETVRSVELHEGAPHQLVVHHSAGVVRIRSAQPASELRWVAEAIGCARERKAQFWRDLLDPSRHRQREALARVTARQA